MIILSIETSCDETAAAVIEDGTKIISNVVASSMEIHKNSGGIIPEIAAREQVKCIIPVINEALRLNSGQAIEQSSSRAIGDIDSIAVTVGPGLNGSLLVGVETAKTIAYETGKPIIPVNHIFAHIYANWLLPQPSTTNHQLLTFPAIALVVSGGHTELFLMKSHTDIKWLGGTLDDAAGEAFDKTARLLGLGFPGGPAIAAEAAKLPTTNYQLPTDIKLPRPMINSGDLNFSFSGLKTAVVREVNKLKAMKPARNATHSVAGGQFNHLTIQQLSFEIQESITDVLVKKTLDAAKKYKVKSILLGGGVAANKRLKKKFLVHSSEFLVAIPQVSLCTDNAAYIGSFAYFHYKPVPWKDINAQPDLTVEV